jgi:hypothetical protein
MISDDNVGQVGERHINRRSPVVTPTVTTFTLTAADADNLRIFTAAGATTVTVPTNTVAPNIPIGSSIRLSTTGAGGLTISGAGITFTGAALTGAQNVTKVITKIDANAWFCER